MIWLGPGKENVAAYRLTGKCGSSQNHTKAGDNRPKEREREKEEKKKREQKKHLASYDVETVDTVKYKIKRRQTSMRIISAS